MMPGMRMATGVISRFLSNFELRFRARIAVECLERILGYFNKRRFHFLVTAWLDPGLGDGPDDVRPILIEIEKAPAIVVIIKFGIHVY
jgi:hypothetical protein